MVSDWLPMVNLCLLVGLAFWAWRFLMAEEKRGIAQLKSELPVLVIDALFARGEWREHVKRLDEAEARLLLLENRLDQHLEAETG